MQIKTALLDSKAKQLTIYNNSEKAVEQRLETLVACGDDLVKHLQKKHEREHYQRGTIKI